MRFFIFILALATSFSSFAETFLGIGPLDNLGDIQQRFPHANIKKISAARTHPEEILYEMEGFGLNGTIILLFSDFRPTYKNWAETSEDPEDIEAFKIRSQRSDAEALSIRWVRWIPNNRLPLEHLVSKYGPPEKSVFPAESYGLSRSWERAGVTAYLSNDEKYVKRIDFSFTKGDRRQAYVQKKLPVPDWFKDISSISGNSESEF